MSSLREVKDRISSVRSTLKITSAMKLVASSKLLKAQRAAEALRPYEETLARILSRIPQGASAALPAAVQPEPDVDAPSAKSVVLAFAGNTSMCGAFNSNAVKLALETIRGLAGDVEVWAFGRKMAEALRKAGVPAARDYSALIAAPSSGTVSEICAELRSLHEEGSVGSVRLVYNHFVSTGRQVPVCETLLPFDGSSAMPGADGASSSSAEADYILEPSASELIAGLIPQVLDLKLYAALLDSVAAEHAARMVAMQTATDNAQDLLAELTLEYNKGRQQKITSEILDLVGGESRD